MSSPRQHLPLKGRPKRASLTPLHLRGRLLRRLTFAAITVTQRRHLPRG